MTTSKKIHILFVCMGNICRSPSAEGVFQKLVTDEHLQEQFIISSAGTHAYHIDEAPDLRSQKAAKDRDIDISQQRAKKVIFADFENFDYLLAMDKENYNVLLSACPDEYKHKIHLFLDYAPETNTQEVPDPYYGGTYGFEKVLDLIEAASVGFLTHLKNAQRLK